MRAPFAKPHSSASSRRCRGRCVGSPMQPVGPGDQVRALYDYSDPDKLSFLEVRGAAPHPDRICATTQLTDLLSPCFLSH